MMTKKCMAILITVLLSVSVILGGCQGASKVESKPKSTADVGQKVDEENTVEEKKVEINFFFYKDTIVEGMDKMAAAFMKKHSNVTIKNEMIAAEYNTVLKTKDAAGRLPEVFAASTPGEMSLSPYSKSGKIMDVSDFKVIKNLSEDYAKSITFSDGKKYIVPFLTTARGVIYNKELFKKAGINEFPKTLDEMKTACASLKDAEIIPFAAGAKDGWTLGSLIFQVGQEVFSSPEWIEKRNKGTASFKDNAMPVFDFIDLFLANCQKRPMDTDYMGSVELYATKQAAMLVQGPWAMDAIVDLDEAVAENSHMGAIPFRNDSNKLYFDYDAYFCVSSSADAKTIDEYFDFMINGEGKEIFKSDIKALNPYGIEFETHNVNNDILKAVNEGNIIGDFQYVNMPDGFWQTFATGMQEYTVKKISKEQMLEKFDSDWDAMK